MISVPRDTLQKWLDDIGPSRHVTQYARFKRDELHALIAKPAAQHQGEMVVCMPIERCYDVRAKMIIAFNEARKAGGDLDDALDAAYKSALRYSPNPLTAEQPA